MASNNRATLTIHGVAAPGGSKSGFVVPGTRHANLTHASKKTRPWMDRVEWQAREQWEGEPIGKGYYVEVEVTFYLPRPGGHHSKASGKRSTSYRKHPTTKPDLTKLWRSTEDALTGIVWKDDTQVSGSRLYKRYADLVDPCVLINIMWYDNTRDYDKEGE